MKRKITKILAAFALLVFTMPSLVAWGQTRGEGDTHDFAQSLEQLLNNNAAISSIQIPAQSYPVKKVTISYRYNKNIQNAVTMEVTVNGTSWGTKYSTGTGSNYTTVDFEGESTTGAIVISFTNNTGSGTGHGTFYVNNVTLTEGPGGSSPTTYTVTYNAGDGTGSMTDPNSPYTAGATVTLLPNTFTAPTGYEWSSWEVKDASNNTVSVSNNQFIMPSSNVTVTAQYTQSGGNTSGTATLTASNLELTGSYTTNTEKTINGITYVYTDLMLSTSRIQAKASTGTIKNTTAYPGDITSVVITHDGTERATTINGSADGTNWTQVATGNGSITANFSGLGYKYFQITRGSNAAYWTKIEISYSTGGGSLNQSDLTITNQSTALSFDLYNNTTSQVINYTTSSTGAITVAPLQSDYFTCVHDAQNKTITVTPTAVTPSAQTVTITQAADDNYAVGTASFTVNITDSTPFEGFVFNTDEGLAALNIAKPSASNGTDLNPDENYVAGDVTMNITHGSTNTRVWNSNGATDLRVYNGGTLTFSVPTGYAITEISFTGNTIALSGLTDNTWTASGDPVRTVTLTNNATASKINTISVTYEANATVVDAPTLPEATAFLGTMNVEISNIPQGATVYYTTDESDPKTSTTRQEYIEAIVLNSTTTIKAVAFIDPNYSAIVEATYTLISQKTIAEVRAQGTGDVYTQGVVTSCVGITGYIQDNNAAICVYGAELTVGNEIRVMGTLSSYSGLLEITDPTIEVVSQGNTVNPTVMTIAEINASSNQGWFIRIENATVTAINNQNTTIAQGENTIVVRGISGIEYEVDDILSLNGNIGCYTNVQIANPSNVTKSDFRTQITINGYGNNDGGYYLIASPVAVNPAEVDGMIITGADAANYDLYSFDQTGGGENGDGKEWRNYKQGAFNSLVPGKGYLYANKTTVDLTFTNNPVTGDPIDVDLVYNANATLKGYNLIGNPFSKKAYIGRAFYVMNEGGTEIVAANRTYINPMEGVFVIAADADDNSVTFSTIAPDNNGDAVALNVKKNSGNVIDRAIVRFDEGQQLPKFQLFENSTKLYIPQGNNDYAVVRSAAEAEMPVSFKASENGTYTLAVETENVEMNYLHLIDNLTGMDVDLLQTPSYTFEAKTNDYTSRFRLVFKANGTNENNAETFAYFNGTNWTVSNVGDATLQVVDVTGRMVSNETISGNATISLNQTPGVYMLRLVNGDNVKTQKVVVR